MNYILSFLWGSLTGVLGYPIYNFKTSTFSWTSLFIVLIGIVIINVLCYKKTK